LIKLRNQELIILIVTVVIFAGFSIFLDKFFSTGNLLTLMRSVSILGILSIAMAVVVISKGIDLSLIATLAVGTALASVMSSPDVLPSFDLPFVYAVLLGFLFTAILCAITGILVAYWDMASVFVTLAMAGVIYGLGRTLFIGDELNYLPEDAIWLEYLGRGQLLGVPMPIICFLSLAFIMHLVLKKTTFGKFVYSIGDSGLAARTAGVPVRPILVIIFVIAGLVAYFAGLLTAGAISSINTRMVSGSMIYDVLLVVVVGGIGLSGGKGGMHNVILGTLLIGTLLNGMVIMDISFIVQNLIKGIILLIAIMTDTILNPRDEQTTQQGDI
jgi:ribose transport system permease protein|tara:strand:+ start:753 stop:1739 length:987 start_codon:yes stop_codon:yes gene_type:complete